MSQYTKQPNTHTGNLERRTLLHKRYLILRTVGHGGMGAVYQARDMKRQTICAVKEMSLSMVPLEEQAKAIHNFKTEAKMLWGLNHPNLPAFTGFFAEGQRYFMVMEYIEGHTLEELLERNGSPFPERRVLGWARQLCDVLQYLHSQNPPIIFRDMKPGNIMLMRTGRVKLIDFGIARFFRPTSFQDTQLLGTPGFAPPEQYGKAQTDERADIYSLAITLFQLLTNTLSETGFGLKDVRSVNPHISSTVARALEKAAALDPDDRFDDIVAFRRALLGVGTFLFENGDQATTPAELADLCARYPEEASDYLSSGEIESWLLEIGATDFARLARQIRPQAQDPQEAVAEFLRAVMGSNARIRPSSISAHSPHSQTGSAAEAHKSWFSPSVHSAAPLQVQPRLLDFGQVYHGISQPLIFTITGNQGMLVSGTIRPIQPWLLVDQTVFDGMSTRVSVRVNSMQLYGQAHYTGTILVSPYSSNGQDDEVGEQDIVVTVEADVLEFGSSALPVVKQPDGKTGGADLDEEDDDDLTMGSITTGAAGSIGQMQAVQVEQGRRNGQNSQKMAAVQVGLPSEVTLRDEEYKIKYGQPGIQQTSSNGWDPLQATNTQRLWMQRGLAFLTAFMLASFCYTLLTPLVHLQPLPPSPWFILLLSLFVPTATVGAIAVRWNRSWNLQDVMNRMCTGMGSALLPLALFEIGWQMVLPAALVSLQLVVMLFVTAFGATLGTAPKVSDRVLSSTHWGLKRLGTFFVFFVAALGGILGYFLTSGFALSGFTPFGICFGIGVYVGLILCVDRMMKQQKQQGTASEP